MSLCIPHVWIAGDDATSTALQTETDSIVQLQGGTPTATGTILDFFRAVQATVQSGLTAATFVSITFDTTSEVFDFAGGHSVVTNTSRYIPQVAGIMEVSGCIAFATNATGRRFSQIALNGAAVAGSQGGCPGIVTSATDVTQPVVYVTVNGTTDFIEIQGFSDQASWGTSILNSSASALNVRWVHK
jgi:hypothetical protein